MLEFSMHTEQHDHQNVKKKKSSYYLTRHHFRQKSSQCRIGIDV